MQNANYLQKKALFKIMDDAAQFGPFGRDQGTEARAAIGLPPFLPADVLLEKKITDALWWWIRRYLTVAAGCGLYNPEGTQKQRDILRNSWLAFGKAGSLVCKSGKGKSSSNVCSIQFTGMTKAESIGTLYDEKKHGIIQIAKKDGYSGVFDGWRLEEYTLIKGEWLHQLNVDLDLFKLPIDMKHDISERDGGRIQLPEALIDTPRPNLYSIQLMEMPKGNVGRPPKKSKGSHLSRCPTLHEINAIVTKRARDCNESTILHPLPKKRQRA